MNDEQEIVELSRVTMVEAIRVVADHIQALPSDRAASVIAGLRPHVAAMQDILSNNGKGQ